MSLVVISYPEWTTADGNWIESIREQHDKRYFGVVDAHVTLVFPVAEVAEDELVRHVHAVADHVQPIDLVLESARVVKDSFAPY